MMPVPTRTLSVAVLLVLTTLLNGVVVVEGTTYSYNNDEFTKISFSSRSQLAAEVECSGLDTAGKKHYLGVPRDGAALNVAMVVSGSTTACFIGSSVLDSTYFWMAASPRSPSTKLWCSNCAQTCTTSTASGSYCYRQSYSCGTWYNSKTCYKNYKYYEKIPVVYASYISGNWAASGPSGTTTSLALTNSQIQSTESTSCAICAAYKCNLDDGDGWRVTFNETGTALVCNGRGTISGWYPTCTCECDKLKQYRGSRCQYDGTATLSLTLSLPMTNTSAITTTKTPPLTQTSELPVTASNTLSLSPTGQSLTLTLPSRTRHSDTPLPSISRTHATLTPSTSHSLVQTSTVSIAHHTLSSFYTTTVSTDVTVSGMTATLVKSHTLTASASSSTSIGPNVTLVGELFKTFPLMSGISVDADQIRAGSTARVNLTQDATALWDLMQKAGAVSDASRRRMSVMSVMTMPIIGVVPGLGSSSGGVTGNAKGFFLRVPEVTARLFDDYTLNVTLSALPEYTITVGEKLHLYTTLNALLPSDIMVDPNTDGNAYRLIGTIDVGAPLYLQAAPSSLAVTAVTSAGGVVAGASAAAELQAMGALAMMTCSDPTTRGTFGSYRILSPAAPIESYAGVVAGNLAVTVAVFVLQGIALVVLRVCKRLRRTEMMAAARFPSLTVQALGMFHTGTAFASSQLISQSHQYAMWEVAVGVVGAVVTILIPVALMVYPYLRIGRAYQAYDMFEWLRAHNAPTWTTRLLPRGAIYSPETRKAFDCIVSDVRAPPRQVMWTSTSAWTPTVFFFAGLVHPTTVPHCQALFVCIGVVMVASAVAIMWCAPFRSDVTSWLAGTTRLCVACVTFCMAAALVADGTVDDKFTSAVQILAFILLGVAVLTLVHMVLCMVVECKLQADPISILVTRWTHIIIRKKSKGSTKSFNSGFNNALGDALLNAQDIEGADQPLTFENDADDDGIEMALPERRTTTKAKAASKPVGSSVVIKDDLEDLPINEAEGTTGSDPAAETSQSSPTEEVESSVNSKAPDASTSSSSSTSFSSSSNLFSDSPSAPVEAASGGSTDAPPSATNFGEREASSSSSIDSGFI